MDRDLNYFIEGWTGPFQHPLPMEILRQIPPILCWCLWKERNNWIFKDTERSPKEFFGIGSRIITESTSLFIWKPPDKAPTERDIKMEKYWNIKLEINSFENFKSLARRNVVWNPPGVGWFKLNFDGVTKGNPGMASIGGVIRDCKGNFVVGFVGGIDT